MQTLTNEALLRLNGRGGFWDGLACGAGVGMLIGMSVSPEPFTKLAWGRAAATAIVACARMF